MSPLLSPTLPDFERNLLHIVRRLVPSHERDEWSRTWQAELWYMHQRSRHRHVSPVAGILDLSIGLTRDAVWLRTEKWRVAFSDTAMVCLASLLSLSLLSILVALAVAGSWHSLHLYLRDEFTRSLLAAPHVLFVLLATAPRRYSGPSNITRWRSWIKRQFFFVLKTLQIVLLAFLLSVDLCLPLHTLVPLTADLLQLFAFVLFALLGLRWAIGDQEERCKQCLRSLSTPARVGRPSHNLLEWNGTELSCKHGHGLLSIPEMETSWCESSRWINLNVPI
ncbi:MAG: hypothetical protein WCB58_12960 [Acidobacteriaceae bacterium]